GADRHFRLPRRVVVFPAGGDVLRLRSPGHSAIADDGGQPGRAGRSGPVAVALAVHAAGGPSPLTTGRGLSGPTGSGLAFPRLGLEWFQGGPLPLAGVGSLTVLVTAGQCPAGAGDRPGRGLDGHDDPARGTVPVWLRPWCRVHGAGGSCLGR